MKYGPSKTAPKPICEVLVKPQARHWCLSDSASCKKFLLCFSASFEKSGLNDENLDIFGFQVLAKMQQRAERRQYTPWDHSTWVLLLLLLLLLYAYKIVSCCTIIHKIGAFWDNCRNKFVCTLCFASSVFVFVDTDAHLADDLFSFEERDVGQC